MRAVFLCLFLTLLNTHASTNKIADYTLYFSSYHYEFSLPHQDENINRNKLLISNEDIFLEYTTNNEFILDQRTTLNFSNDAQFSQINLIKRAPQSKTIPSHTLPPNNTTNQRRLLWSKWDHTKEKHIRKGRYIGDSSKVRTFDDARSLCREFYGDIASIRSDTENKQLQDLCKKTAGTSSKSCWIGLTQPYYEWEDAHYVGYSNWMDQAPSRSIDEKCSFIKRSTGQWDDYPCNRELYAICEKPIATYHGSFVVISKQTTEGKAAAFCKRKFGSTLASILSAADALQAHEACKLVAKAPHGCWIGLTAPFKAWDNGLQVESIPNNEKKGTNLDWENGQIPKAKGLKCTEMNKKGYWKGIPCDYERHILCNVHGVDTKQSEKDKEWLAKKAEEERQKKLEEQKKKAAQLKTMNSEDRSEGAAEGSNTKAGDKVNPSDPIEKQIESLKKILKQQQERLEKEKAKFEQGGSVHKLGTVEGMKAMEQSGKHQSGDGYKGSPMQGLKDEIQRLEGVQGGHGMSEIKSAYGLNMKGGHHGVSGIRPDRMGNMVRAQRMQQRSGMAGNPFGGAFGGNPYGGTGNPYNGMGPMSYGQFLGRMNPLALPSTSQGRYAQRRRLIESDASEMRVRKCVFELGKEVCIEYDYMHGEYSVDVMMGERREAQQGIIGYYMVYEFVFMFDLDGEIQCGFENGYSVCMNHRVVTVKNINGSEEYMFDYRNDTEWNEIYIGQTNEKCVHVLEKIFCVIEDDIDSYRLEMKLKMNV